MKQALIYSTSVMKSHRAISKLATNLRTPLLITKVAKSLSIFLTILTESVNLREAGKTPELIDDFEAMRIDCKVNFPLFVFFG